MAFLNRLLNQMILSIDFAMSQRLQCRVMPTLDIVLGGKDCELLFSLVPCQISHALMAAIPC
jgi:hypothetical protein